MNKVCKIIKFSGALSLCATVVACSPPTELTVSENGVKQTISLEQKGTHYPADFPIAQYPNSRVIATSEGPIVPGTPAGKTVGLMSKDTKAAIIAYYKNQLSTNGWREEADSAGKQDRQKLGMFGFSRNKQNVLIQVRSGEELGGTMISITLISSN